MAKTKVVSIPKGCLNLGLRGKTERTIARWQRRGWRYVDSHSTGPNIQLVFVKDTPPQAVNPTRPQRTPPPPNIPPPPAHP